MGRQWKQGGQGLGKRRCLPGTALGKQGASRMAWPLSGVLRWQSWGAMTPVPCFPALWSVVHILNPDCKTRRPRRCSQDLPTTGILVGGGSSTTLGPGLQRGEPVPPGETGAQTRSAATVKYSSFLMQPSTLSRAWGHAHTQTHTRHSEGCTLGPTDHSCSCRPSRAHTAAHTQYQQLLPPSPRLTSTKKSTQILLQRLDSVRAP